MAAGSTQPGQPVFVAGTRPRVVVPASAGTQPPARQFVVPHPLVATNSPSPQPVSSRSENYPEYPVGLLQLNAALLYTKTNFQYWKFPSVQHVLISNCLNSPTLPYHISLSCI